MTSKRFWALARLFSRCLRSRRFFSSSASPAGLSRTELSEFLRRWVLSRTRFGSEGSAKMSNSFCARSFVSRRLLSSSEGDGLWPGGRRICGGGMFSRFMSPLTTGRELLPVRGFAFISRSPCRGVREREIGLTGVRLPADLWWSQQRHSWTFHSWLPCLSWAKAAPSRPRRDL